METFGIAVTIVGAIALMALVAWIAFRGSNYR